MTVHVCRASMEESSAGYDISLAVFELTVLTLTMKMSF